MKHYRKIILLLLVVLGLSACVSIPIGDGNKVKIGKGGFTVVSSEGEEVKIDMDEEGIQVHGKETGEIAELTKEGLNIQSKDGKESKMTFNEEDGGIKVQGFNDEGEAVDFEMGENVDLPKGFLKDIPLTNDANIMMSGENNTELWVSYMTSESVEKTDKLYKDYFKGNIFIEKPEIYENKADESIVKAYEGERKEGVLMVQLMTEHYEGEDRILVNISLTKTNNN